MKPAEHDQHLRERLRRQDNRAGALFFLIPVVLLVLGGKPLGILTLPLWYVYTLGWIITFRRLSSRFLDPGNRDLARRTRNYPFHGACWVLFSLFSLGVLCWLAEPFFR
ncbi:MAG: hypothetical protein GAK45_01621 [Pseudomonas citronellolis]|nr:MAG: hypothetical protein GAK45_01621 [Pseudomonas citronellolis]